MKGAKAGVVLPKVQTIVGIQLARDLGGESYVYGDRAGGEITVEYSVTASSDLTPWSSSTGWVRADSITGWAANTPNYYRFSTPVNADGLRITLADGGTCVDELEIYAVGGVSLITAPTPAPGIQLTPWPLSIQLTDLVPVKVPVKVPVESPVKFLGIKMPWFG